jgi:truncated hemoglobin YjbI
VEIFVQRVFEDPMIGFLFQDKSRLRIQELEYQLAAEQLGADVTYQGRPLAAVHAPHPIMGGHFDRRRQILVNVLVERSVPLSVQETWLEHVDSLRSTILGQVEDEHHCNHDIQGERMPSESE